MDRAIAEGVNFISVLQVGGFWRGMDWNPGHTTFITEISEVKEVAQAAARTFAEEHQLRYEEGPLILKKPVSTVVKIGNNWVPVVIFAESITPGVPSRTAEKALNQAEAIAQSHDYEYSGDFGSKLFS